MQTRSSAAPRRTSEWTSDLDLEVRQQLQLLHEPSPLYHSKILLLLAIWLLSGSVAIWTGSMALKLLAWAVIGLALHALAVFMHEGAHENLFRVRWLDRLVGFLAGVPVFFSCSNYRATHTLHHRYENTERDPDNFNRQFPGQWTRRLAFYAFLVAGMPFYVLHTTVLGPFRAESWKETTLCLLEVTLMIAGYWWLFWAAARYGFAGWLLEGWLLALPVTIAVANVRGLSEHTMLKQGDPPDPLQSTRTTRSHPLVSFFLNNQNYHLEHHLFPRIPWYNLPKVHRLLSPLYARREAAVTNGYLQNLSDSFRYGPMEAMCYDESGFSRPAQVPESN